MMTFSISIIAYTQIQITSNKLINQMKVLIFTTFLLALISSSASQINIDSGDSSINSRKHDQTPSIRKCMNVSCDAGFFCFHGRCKKIDYECLNKHCDKGFRCNKGQCVKQLYKPRKQICAPLGFQQTKKQCSDEVRKRCLTGKSSIKVCGYFANRDHQDFDSQCSACAADSKVRFYYETTCQWAPRICKETEECLNGICTVLFYESVFENYRTCNKNEECKPHERCGGHKCIDRRDMFNYLLSKAETTHIGLLI